MIPLANELQFQKGIITMSDLHRYCLMLRGKCMFLQVSINPSVWPEVRTELDYCAKGLPESFFATIVPQDFNTIQAPDGRVSFHLNVSSNPQFAARVNSSLLDLGTAQVEKRSWLLGIG